MTISPDDLQVFLTDHLRASITAVERVNQGEWSQTFFFTARGQRKVIRFSAFNEDFQKDRFAARFASPRLPIPAIEEIGAALGAYFAISPYVSGKMIDHLSNGEMHAIVPGLMDVLIALQAVDGSATQGYGGFDASGNAAGQSWREILSSPTGDTPGSRLYGWRERLALVPEAHRLYQAGQERLHTLIPRCPEERHLIHNDLLHFNVITSGNRIAGVIDWGCAMWGDFLYDLAMIAAWQFYYPAMTGIDFIDAAQRAFTDQGIALPEFEARLLCYQLHLLLDSLAYNAWKQDTGNLTLTANRLREILEKTGAGL